MAIKALTLSRTADYQSDLDPAKGTTDATVFKIGAIDSFVSSYIFDRTLVFNDRDDGSRAVAQIKLNEVNLDAVRFGLKGWKNYKDAEGNDIEFKTAERIVLGRRYIVVADECLAVMDIVLIRELANAIQELNNVTKDEAGKSDAA